MTTTTFPNNPYIIGRPIYEAESFFGREEIFQFIRDNLENEAQVILLFGQRRIGKSSILKQIPNSVNLEKFVFVRLSLQGKSQKSLGEVLYELAEDIKDEIVNQLKIDPDAIKLPLLSEFKTRSQVFIDQFLPQVYEVLEDRNLVLLIDEFDVLGDHPKDAALNHFFPYLDSILPKQKKLFIIPVVGRRLDDMPNLLNLFKEAPYKKIGLLDKYDTQQLITKPAQGILTYEPAAVQAIFELSAGHPYFTQVICFAIYGRLRNQKQSWVQREDVEEIVEKALEYGEGGLSWFYDGLTMPERVIFSSLAEIQGKQDIELWQFLKQHRIGKTKTLIKAHNRLQSWELIQQTWELITTDIPTYKITVELVRRWLLKRHPDRQEAAIYKAWLLAKSKRHLYVRGGVTALALVISSVAWWVSPWGQIQQVRWELAYLSSRVDDSAAESAAVAFARDNQLNKALYIIENDIQYSHSEVGALTVLAEAYTKLNNTEKASQLLDKSLSSAEKTEDSYSKAFALTSIAEAYANLKYTEKASELLAKSLSSVEKIENSDFKGYALSAIAKAYANLKDTEKASELLAKTLSSAEKIENSFVKANALAAIAEAIANLKDTEKASELLAKSLSIAEKIEDSYYKAYALTAIAEAYANLKDTEKASELLVKSLSIAEKIEDSYYKTDLLIEIAKAYAKLNDTEKASELLAKSLSIAEKIEDSYYKTDLLIEIAKAYAKLNDTEKASELLAKSLSIAETIEDSNSKANVLTTIAETYTQLNELERAIAIADRIRDNPEARANVLKAVAEAYAGRGDWSQARQVIEKMTVEDVKAEALAQILIIWTENR